MKFTINAKRQQMLEILCQQIETFKLVISMPQIQFNSFQFKMSI